ncbi:MAG TPA: nucleoside-diphosphate kinase [Polyangia bacterium]|jgi:nucleoside-diphosphate kinase|nr:nucleoside-diphosphate kinase [Polyangia bacterium]
MSIERTFGIVKPDAVAKNAVGGVIDMVEKAGLKIVGLRLVHLSDAQARAFYAVHKERPFFGDLVRFMTSGPAVVMAIEGESAVARYREAMGPTDSKKAPAGTIRQKYGTDIEKNAVHGSDGPDTARGELAFFFAGLDLA